MPMFRFENPSTGVVLGEYPGETPTEAYAALCRDAGYETPEAAYAVTGEGIEALYVREVEPIPCAGCGRPGYPGLWPGEERLVACAHGARVCDGCAAALPGCQGHGGPCAARMD